MADLSVEVCGLRFRNPILPAAGPPVRDGAAIVACAEGGAGGLVAKTISTRAAEPPTPNMAEIPHGFVNTELWSELPPEQWLETEYALARTAGLPLIVSLGYTGAEIAELAPKVAPFADAVELSTHYIGEDPEPMMSAVRAAKAALDVPVLVKLSPHGHDLGRAARLARGAGVTRVAPVDTGIALQLPERRPELDRGEHEEDQRILARVLHRGAFAAKQFARLPMQENHLRLAVIVGVPGCEEGEEHLRPMLLVVGSLPLEFADMVGGGGLLGSGRRLFGGSPTRLNCVKTRFQISTGLPCAGWK